MERPPTVVEYVCLLCGTQGTKQVGEGGPETTGKTVAEAFVCPRCGNPVTNVRSVLARDAVVVGG